MKKITLFLFSLLVTSAGFAQVVLEDFDGATAPTIGFANGPGSATIVADPTGGGNGNVLEVITAASSAPWQQAELTLQDTFLDLTTANKTVSVDWYSVDPFGALIRVDAGTGAPATTSAQHPGGGWQTLQFDFNFVAQPGQGLGVPNGFYTQIFFFNLWDTGINDFIGGGSDTGSIASLTYVDSIVGLEGVAETCFDGMLNNGETDVDCGGPNCEPCPLDPPSVGAPTPPNRPQDEVFSIYSDAYDNDIPNGITYDAGFCSMNPSSSEVQFDGDNVLLFDPSVAVCLGWDWINPDNIANPFGAVDLSSFGFLHFDVYTDDAALFRGDGSPKAISVKFANFSNGGVVESNSFEVLLRANNVNNDFILEAGTWLSIDVDFSNRPTGPPPAFLPEAGDIIRNAVGQLIFTGADLTNVWFDNIYFHQNTTLSDDEFSINDFKVFPNPTTDKWNVSSTGIVNSVKIYDVLGKQVISLSPNATEVSIETATLNPGIYFARITGVKGSKTVKLIKE